MNIIKFKDLHPTQFRIINYPDGQRNIELYLDKLNVKEETRIECRIKTFADLEILSCLIAALRKNDFDIATLVFYYLFGMRSDRGFSLGEPNYFRDIIAPLINSFAIPGVELFCPHNDSNLRCIKARRLIKAWQPPLMFRAIAADKSAGIRENAADDIYFEKIRRDQQVIVSGLSHSIQDINRFPILIVDDLIDGGATFIEAAKYLRANYELTQPISLKVDHALFTRGLEPILEHFDTIYTTNSYQDIDHPRVIQTKVI